MVKQQVKKKILFVLPNLNYGGAEKVTINFFNNLCDNKFVKKLLIQNNKGPLENKIIQKNNVKYFGYKRFLYFSFILSSHIKKNNYDYIYSTLSHISFFLLFLKIIGIFKGKLIVRESNFINKTIKSSKNKLLLLFYYKILYKKIDKVIASSQTIFKDIHHYTKIKKKKLLVLYNPVEISFFNKKNVEKKRDINKKIKFLSIGRLTYQKNFDKLIKVLSNYDKNNWELKIIGKGNQKKYLSNLIRELGLDNKIKIIKESNTILQEIKRSDYYLISSRWEGMPNSVIENIIMKKKIIFFNKIEVFNELKDLFPKQIIYFKRNYSFFNKLHKPYKLQNNQNCYLFEENIINYQFEKLFK